MASKLAPTLVLLVRHGLTGTTGKRLPGREPGLHLSAAGQRMAEQVAERVAALPKVDAVYASALERAQETARPIARATGLRVRTRAALADTDTGEWTGRLLSQLSRKPEWKTVQRTPSTFRFPDGESFPESQLRITTAIEAICATHPGGTVVAVSHADPIKLALAQALGMHLDHFQRLTIAPCSVSAVLYGAHSPQVLTVNSPPDGSTLFA